MKIEVRNFQTIRHLIVDLNGFVILKGETGAGKSALRRAIEVVLYNRWSDNYLRKDTKQVEITLSFDDVIIKRVRSKTVNKYIVTVNGETTVYDKVGRNVPQIVKELGFKQLETIDGVYNLQVSKQIILEPLFITSYTDNENTKILNTVFDVTKYEEANKKVSKDIKALKSEIGFLDKDVEKIVVDRVEISKELEIVQKCETLLQDIGDIQRYIKSVKSYTEIEKKVRHYKKALPRVNAATAIYKYIDNSKTYQYAKDRVSVIESFETAYNNYETISRYIFESGKVLEMVMKLETINHKLDALKKYARYGAIKTYFKRIENSHTLSMKMRNFNTTLDRYEELQTVLQYLQTVLTSQQYETGLQSKMKQLEDVEKAIKQYTMKLGGAMICPKCGTVCEESA